jgi:UDP-3-O-[3-hydroxymyristoyl] N-acetylglucosamine deacetylase
MAGIGLHTGHPVRVVVRPASAEYGIWFRRVDMNDCDNLIPALYENVCDTQLCTKIANAAGASVSTIEHLMAAFAGCGITNALVDVDGPELPIMDGSARRFVREIMQAGIQQLRQPARVLRILAPVQVTVGEAVAALVPADTMEIDFSIEFADTAIGAQSRRLGMANGAFVHELADCRTFCLQSEVDVMQSNGLALGGSYDNAIVVDGAKVLNPGGFRRVDECVRHKMLDALGDLSLAGAPILGRYTGIRAGHGITNALLRKLFATPGAFEMIEATPAMLRQLPGAGVTLSDLRLAV